MKYAVPACLATACLAASLSASPALAGSKVDPRCANYGPGFIYSETTGFCIRVSGEIDTGAGFGSGNGRSHSSDRFRPDGDHLSDSGLSGTATVSIDARKETEAGPLRIFVAPQGAFGN